MEFLWTDRILKNHAVITLHFSANFLTYLDNSPKIQLDFSQNLSHGRVSSFNCFAESLGIIFFCLSAMSLLTIEKISVLRNFPALINISAENLYELIRGKICLELIYVDEGYILIINDHCYKGAGCEDFLG